MKVAIIMGSDSDWPVMKAARDICNEFNVDCETHVVSAHRTPDLMAEYAKNARSRGFEIIIAGAGGAAHLPGMVASFTTLPVIGVPVESKTLKGIDSLLSIVQMPKGIPVATVAINNAANAALLAIRILGTTDSEIADKLEAYHKQMREESIRKSEMLL